MGNGGGATQEGEARASLGEDDGDSMETPGQPEPRRGGRWREPRLPHSGGQPLLEACFPGTQPGARAIHPRTLLDTGLPGAGDGGGGGRWSGPRLLALGLPGGGGFCSLGSRSRHGGPDGRGAGCLVFLVLAAHAAAGGRGFLTAPGSHASRSQACAPRACVLHPGLSGLRLL